MITIPSSPAVDRTLAALNAESPLSVVAGLGDIRHVHHGMLASHVLGRGQPILTVKHLRESDGGPVVPHMLVLVCLKTVEAAYALGDIHDEVARFHPRPRFHHRTSTRQELALMERARGIWNFLEVSVLMQAPVSG